MSMGVTSPRIRSRPQMPWLLPRTKSKGPFTAPTLSRPRSLRDGRPQPVDTNRERGRS